MNNYLSIDFSLGAIREGANHYRFRVWAPFCVKVDLKLLSGDASRLVPMVKDSEGYFCVHVSDVVPGARYVYVLDDEKERPDPASRFQPEGVHGPSCIVDSEAHQWNDKAWKGMALRDMIFYEIHVGTFTPEGTFDAAVKKVAYLKELGVTCLEIMPVAQFPGERNWGYDGVDLYAVQDSYGGPEGLKRLVDECHRQGIAVCLDVVYNHFGPEGNYLHDFGPYFTKKYNTPWGDAVNFDDQYCDPVRHFIIQNACYWIKEYHIDALRLDAIHGIFDFSARHLLQELNDSVQVLADSLGRNVHVIAESDLNDSRIIRSKPQGYGLAGQWSDDFHHAIHAFLSGEVQGYYEGFGRLSDLAKAIENGFVYDGVYSSHRKRIFGNSVKDLPAEQLVVATQNHDQVGNRAFGDRLSALINFDQEKLAAVLLLLAPQTPLLFMGQEYSEKSPFQYFIDHTDTDLIEAVRQGRKREFASFGWTETPDPKAKETFLNSKLTWTLDKETQHYQLWQLYQELIRLRKASVVKHQLKSVRYDETNQWLIWEYAQGSSSRLGIVLSFAQQDQIIADPFDGNEFCEVLYTASECYGGLPTQGGSDNAKDIWVPACSAIVVKI